MSSPLTRVRYFLQDLRPDRPMTWREWSPCVAACVVMAGYLLDTFWLRPSAHAGTPATVYVIAGCVPLAVVAIVYERRRRAEKVRIDREFASLARQIQPDGPLLVPRRRSS